MGKMGVVTYTSTCQIFLPKYFREVGIGDISNDNTYQKPNSK